MTNAEIVRAFTEEVFNQGRADLIDQYMQPGYIQHAYKVPQGRDGFKQFHQIFCSRHPDRHLYIKHLYEDGDVIVSHNLAVLDPGETENLVVDIYRLEDGKLAEHWDCVQHLTPEQIRDRDSFY